MEVVDWTYGFSFISTGIEFQPELFKAFPLFVHDTVVMYFCHVLYRDICFDGYSCSFIQQLFFEHFMSDTVLTAGDIGMDKTKAQFLLAQSS